MSKSNGAPAPMTKFTYPFAVSEADDATAPESESAETYFRALARAEDGFFPIGANGQWHGGLHFGRETGATLDQDAGVRCIADGEVLAYRIDDEYPVVEYSSRAPARYSTGFVLVRHRLQLPAARGIDRDRKATAGDDATSEPPAGPSLVFYSLYMHLQNWKAYSNGTGYERPAFWDGMGEYVVGEKARDKEEGLAPGVTGLRVRDASHRPIALLPCGTRMTLGAAVESHPGFHEISGIARGDTVPAGRRTGRVYLPELDRLTTPSATGTVVVLKEPVEIRAGELVGYLGEYQRHADMNPFAASWASRPLAQIDIFTGDDVEAFIRESRARDVQLDAKQKTILHVRPGARFVQPTKPDIELAVGEAAVCVGSNAGERWAKGTRGTIHTVERSMLTGFTPATRTYADGRLFISAVRPDDGSEVTLEQYNALSAANKAGYSYRKVLEPAGEDVWLDGQAANASNPIYGPASVWSDFPLKLANVSDPVVSHSRVLRAKSVEATALEADGTRWFRATAGGGSAGTMEGWVREKDHPNVALCSPWAWPGFVLMDAGTLQPKDLYARAIIRDRQATGSEQKQLESLTQSAEQSPLFDSLCAAIDADGKDGITPLELRHALGKPWLAQALSHLVIKHHSEWAGPMDRWDAIDELIPSSKKEDWEQEKGRIRGLQFWDETQRTHAFPSVPDVHHLHPIGLIANFAGSCPEECRVEYFKLQTTPGPLRISKESFNYILEAERYERHPYVPAGQTVSGITIGYGYDLGHQTEADVRRDLGGLYTEAEINNLVAVIGKKADAARTALPSISSIAISGDDAMTLALRMKQRYADKVVSIYPSAIELHPHCQGSLLSLIINRGSGLSGDTRREMREIHDDLKSGAPENIPARLRSMKRLWRGRNLDGLLKRREKEAELFEEGLKCDCWE